MSYIEEHGKYREGTKAMPSDVASMNKDYEHSLGRKQFAAEIIQPFSHGQPNPDFVKAWPEVAKDYWSEQEIDKILRGELV